jgi:IMP dehydrogenase
VAIIRKSEGITFEDVLLVPQYSDLKSRKEADTSTTLHKLKLKIPIISSNMDTITETQMAIAMGQQGGLGVLHRYRHPNDIIDWIDDIHAANQTAIPSIGTNDSEKEAVDIYLKAGIKAICVDIAHGHSKSMIDMCKYLSKMDITVIAGNVATAAGAISLINAGVNVVKAGVGPGGNCSTRVQTGCGVPQLTAIMDIRAAVGPNYPIIADGGIKNGGDCVKSLAGGANAVMIGGLFGGCTETPLINGERVVRGMASREAQLDFRGSVSNDTPEGVSKKVQHKGSVVDVLKELVGGIRSGMSYCGARTIQELQENAEFIRITQNGWNESIPHGLK